MERKTYCTEIKERGTVKILLSILNRKDVQCKKSPPPFPLPLTPANVVTEFRRSQVYTLWKTVTVIKNHSAVSVTHNPVEGSKEESVAS